MGTIKSIVFSIIPAVIFFGLIEGASQLYWRYLEQQALNATLANGEKTLRNDAINFIKQPDAVLGYRLRSNLANLTNSKGFAQAEEIEERRIPGSLRIVSVGESTTQGLFQGNYPFFLSQILKNELRGYQGDPEVLNAGVSGWVSDQWTKYSENVLRKYAPDVVIFYGGWNDFQSYDPFNGIPKLSWFQTNYGSFPSSVGYLKSVTLGSAIFQKMNPPRPERLSPVTVNWKVMKDAKLQISSTQETKAKLEKTGYVSILVDASHFRSESGKSYRVKFNGKGTSSALLRINGYSDETWPLYAECPILLSENWKKIDCPFKKPPDDHGVQFSIFPRNDNPLSFTVKNFKLFLNEPDGSEKIVASNHRLSSVEIPKGIYRFLFENMTQSIRAFSESNPNVKIVVSSLVSRWPMDTEDQFRSKFGHVWWMEGHRVGRNDAALLLQRLNKELEQFSVDNDLIFVDMAKVFSTLDRQRLMIDFCHMTEDGYKIMAGTFYQELHRRNIVRGIEHSEYHHLLQKYNINRPQNFSVN